MVASYCRVSTDKEDQANSFDAQCRYFQSMILQHPGWELYRVYADEGVTGTSTRHRDGFNKMMSDAWQKKFQLIVTKEVSRFSRNILDTITYTRQLKELDIGVLFINDGINTLEPDAELRLSIMGSIAQEESRKTSSRVTWGQIRQMEQGVVFGRSLLGYHVKHGRMTVDPDGAALVRLIFQKYGVEKKGTRVIAKELEREGYQTPTGNKKWNSSYIIKILHNEKYVGDLVQRKTYTPDYLTHRKKINHGEVEKVVVVDHHEAILDRELWTTVQNELSRRNKNKNERMDVARNSVRYAFSGKIICGECGRPFTVRKRLRKDGTCIKRWCCGTAVAEGRRRRSEHDVWSGCDVGRSLREDAAVEMMRQALLVQMTDLEETAAYIAKLAWKAVKEDQTSAEEKIFRMERELSELFQKKIDVIDACFSGKILEEDMLQLTGRYEEKIKKLKLSICETKRLDSDSEFSLEKYRQETRRLMTLEYVSDVFVKWILKGITVYQNGRSALELEGTDEIFWFEG